MSEERILAEIEDYKRLATNVYELAKEIYKRLEGLEDHKYMLQELRYMLRLLYDLRHEAANELIALMRCINTLEEKND